MQRWTVTRSSAERCQPCHKISINRNSAAVVVKVPSAFRFSVLARSHSRHSWFSSTQSMKCCGETLRDPRSVLFTRLRPLVVLSSQCCTRTSLRTALSLKVETIVLCGGAPVQSPTTAKTWPGFVRGYLKLSALSRESRFQKRKLAHT